MIDLLILGQRDLTLVTRGIADADREDAVGVGDQAFAGRGGAGDDAVRIDIKSDCDAMAQHRRHNAFRIARGQ